jgi:hypothetical protein
MADINKKMPSPEEVRAIFNETYNVFYKKWINSNTPFNADAMMQEVHAINQKYDCKLCRHMLVDLIVCIQNEWKRRNQSE